MMLSDAPRNDSGLVRARSGPPLLGLVFVLAALLGACSSPEPTVQDPLAHASSAAAILPTNVGPSNCSPPSASQAFGPDKLEVKGAASSGGSLWALISHRPPVPSGVSLRIVWRMTGTARLSVTAVGPIGQQVPATGIVLASGVQWDRPGDPWNSTLEFPTSGCWRVSAQRGATHGDVWIQVR